MYFFKNLLSQAERNHIPDTLKILNGHRRTGSDCEFILKLFKRGNLKLVVLVSLKHHVLGFS